MGWLTTMRDNKALTKYVAAFVYGDGTIGKDKRDNGNCWFTTVKTEVNKDFIDFASDILSNITKVNVTKYEPDSNTKPYFRLETLRHPFYNSFRERFYGTGKKAVDPHYLTLLDWETLAILYMDDGTISKTTSNGKYEKYNLELCTQGFTYGDNWLLKRAIKEKLDIEFNIHQRNLNNRIMYSLYLRQKDMLTFLEKVSPFILPSFIYKITPIDFYKSRTNVSVKTDDDIV